MPVFICSSRISLCTGVVCARQYTSSGVLIVTRTAALLANTLSLATDTSFS